MDLDARRAQLLGAGVRLFSERGYGGVSVEDIAGVAGVSKGLLYHYFGGKEAFHQACVAWGADRLVEAVVPDMSLPDLERARRALEAYLDFVEHHSALFLLVMRGGTTGARQVVEVARGRILEQSTAAMGAAPSPAQVVGLRGWIGAVEAASLAWLERGEPDRDEVRDLLIGALVGIRAAVEEPGS